ncbi:Imm50 family immunity protein [uncultured Megamonas sp.]|uniref:Imm50 family immunity protein n=1 Tax=uncultured Megamonas sp. TaxID=286140 RepID=UPI00259BAEF7|nr:Imm50 family immunity protein [uncultured Megamonas sp.]
MWYEFLLDNNKLSSFYKKIPELNNISMINIVFENNGTNIYMDFQMPYLPELLLQTPPKEDNAIFVEIRLIGVKKIYMKTKGHFDNVNISIEPFGDKYNLKSKDNLDLDIIARKIRLIKIYTYEQDFEDI